MAHVRTGAAGPQGETLPGGVAVLVFAPLAGFVLLLAAPSADVQWEDHRAHFWLVVVTALAGALFAYATGEAARRRGDSRLFLIYLAFLAGSGFLAVHALATPGVLLDGPNAGFTLATPVGLLAAAALLALSARDPQPSAGSWVLRALQLGLVAVMAVWVTASLSEVPPLDDPTPTESGSGPLVAVAVVAVGLYALAAWRYLALYRRRKSPLMLSVAAACVLLAEAAIAVTFARNWHASWWEWHLLMLTAFVAVVWTARREGQDEPFSGLYLEDTVAGKREVSVLFADLAGFTSFSENRDPREVSDMLNVYFGAAVPVVRGEQGEIDRVMGDAIMAAFNRRGDQPDHAERAARAAVAVRDATEAVAAEHPDWPRFRIGVNTGEAMTGVLGAAGGRSYTVVGDAVNVAARLETAAPVGGVAISEETLSRLDHAEAEPLGPLAVKGREGPVEAYVLQALGGA